MIKREFFKIIAEFSLETDIQAYPIIIPKLFFFLQEVGQDIWIRFELPDWNEKYELWGNNPRFNEEDNEFIKGWLNDNICIIMDDINNHLTNNFKHIKDFSKRYEVK